MEFAAVVNRLLAGGSLAAQGGGGAAADARRRRLRLRTYSVCSRDAMRRVV
jgi:hypothetical protein